MDTLSTDNLDIYAIDDLMHNAWIVDGQRNKVAVLAPITKKTVDGILAPYKDQEKRDSSEERAYLTLLTTRWGTIEFHEEPLMPLGIILFMDTEDVPDWKARLDESTAVLRGE